MLIWRLTKPEHGPGLDGEGARLWGGRWNSPGVAMVYCASSLALAVLEILVHLPPAMRRAGALPPLTMVGLELPDGELSYIDGKGFDHRECRRHGDAWIAGRPSFAVRVQSFVIHLETNILLNPAHAGKSDVRIVVQEPFRFDDRLVP